MAVRDLALLFGFVNYCHSGVQGVNLNQTHNLNRSYARVFDVFYVTLDFSCLTCPVLMLTCGRWLVYTVDDSLDPHLLVMS